MGTILFVTPKQPAPPKGASAGQSPRTGRLVLSGTEDEISRLFLIPLAILLGRIDRGRRQIFLNDLDIATLADTVGLAAIEPLWRDPSFRESFRSYLKVVGVEPQRGINALSISQSTGIPRETVRRKLKKMLQHDYVTEKTRGRYVMKPGYLQKPETVEIQRDVIRETMKFMNVCLELGVVKLVKPDDQEK